MIRLPKSMLSKVVCAGTLAHVRTFRTLLAGAVLFTGAALFAGAAQAQSWHRLDNTGPLTAGEPLLLTDGSVLVHQPSSSSWYRLIPDQFGNYQHGTWVQTHNMASNYGPLYFASAVLADGRVVVIGGEYNFGSAVWTRRGSIFDPLTNTWAVLASPSASGWSQIGDAQCCVLPDGRFFLAHPLSRKTAVLDPLTLTWSAFGTGKADGNDEEGWTLLPDGTVLTCDASLTPAAERFIPSLATWIDAGSTPLPLADASSDELGPAVLRPDGTVFATGATGHTAVYTPPVNLLDPGTWVAGPDFPLLAGEQLDIADGPACLLPSGNVLCQASPGVFNSPSRFFEFDGTNLTSVVRPPRAANDPSFVGNMLMLPTGQVLFTDLSSDVEIYTPVGAPDDAWRPTITTCPSVVEPGSTYVIVGTQFNGLSQCSAYGDDSTNASNYPLVRLTDTVSGHVHYARTHDHSTMAVATGATPVSTNFTVPVSLLPGTYDLEVVTNGIPSLPVVVTVELTKTHTANTPTGPLKQRTP